MLMATFLVHWTSAHQQNGCSRELPFAKAIQGLIRLFERKWLSRRSHWNFRRQVEKFMTVLAGQIGHGANRAFFPQVAVGKGRNIAHVNASTDDDAALAHGPKSRRNESSDRGEDDRRVKRLGRRFV
jgi:hypothetical protein